MWGVFMVSGLKIVSIICLSLYLSVLPCVEVMHGAKAASASAPGRIIASRNVKLTLAEQEAGVVNLQAVLPIFKRINDQYNIFSDAQYNHYIHNFHYPYRSRFDVQHRRPPAQVVLHWTANRRPDIPLYTLSAFLRSRRRGRIVERSSEHKNVSNYFLTGSLNNLKGQKESFLVKLTRGDLSRWGDIPRVTAYPTKDSYNNRYDGQGAVGIEIESPNFRSFYNNPQQREKIHNFLVLVLSERGELADFASIRRSPHWDDMVALANYLRKNLDRIDVNARGGIPIKYQHLDKIMKDFPDLSYGVYEAAQHMFRFISGHGIVAREYNERMHRIGRPQDARYHKIDFTEPHVFLVAMDLLQSDMAYKGVERRPMDLATLRMIEEQKRAQKQPQPGATPTPTPTQAPRKIFSRTGRRLK